MASRISSQLLEFLKGRFRLDWYGVHGVRHWARVRHNGLLLASHTGADPVVVEHFAFLHDLERFDDYADRGHGARAASAIELVCPRFFSLNEEQANLLAIACSQHSDGFTQADVTVMTCWDADRLDLGRVGIVPDPRYLCTDAAKDPVILESAYRRSVGLATQGNG